MTVSLSRNPSLGANWLGSAPDGMTNWESSRESANRVHVLVNNQGPPVYDLNPSGYRTGSFDLVFKSMAAAFACEAAHAGAARFTLNNTQVPQVGLTYIVAGSVTLRPSSTAAAWIVTVPFQEVAA